MLSKLRSHHFLSLIRSAGINFSTIGDPGPFELLRDLNSADKTLPQFVVGTKNGFLPRQDPLQELPSKFSKLETLLHEMTIHQKDGKQGLLARGEFGERVKALPQYDVSEIEDTHLLTGLFRDYAFATSAYMLEPCHLNFHKTGEYGLGRAVIPKNLSIPFWKIAEKLHARPFMEYAMSYILFNWKRKDPQGPIVFNNLETIRRCEGSQSESGFGIVHVTMDAFTGALVSETESILNAVAKKDVAAFNQHMQTLLVCMTDINQEFETMWSRSKPSDYMNFRTFIMGIKNQPMFPKGVIYEGVTDEPQKYRGETGANDSIVPTVDNLLEVTSLLPNNPLTEVLKDFRTYRPRTHNAWVQWVEHKARFLQVRRFALTNVESALLYLGILDQLRDFRHRHWLLTKAYIIAYTSHPVATGGSPIVTWLPNQLKAVLDIMEDTSKQIDKLLGGKKLDYAHAQFRKDIENKIDAQRRHLEREVDELKKKYPNQDKTSVYN